MTACGARSPNSQTISVSLEVVVYVSAGDGEIVPVSVYPAAMVSVTTASSSGVSHKFSITNIALTGTLS